MQYEDFKRYKVMMLVCTGNRCGQTDGCLRPTENTTQSFYQECIRLTEDK